MDNGKQRPLPSPAPQGSSQDPDSDHASQSEGPLVSPDGMWIWDRQRTEWLPTSRAQDQAAETADPHEGQLISPDGRWVWDAQATEWVPTSKITDQDASPAPGLAADTVDPHDGQLVSPDGRWVWDDQRTEWISTKPDSANTATGRRPFAPHRVLRGRSGRTRLLVAVVAGLVIAGVVSYLLVGRGGDSVPTFTGRGEIDISGPAYQAPYSGLPPLDGYTSDGTTCFPNGQRATTLDPDDGSIQLGVIGHPDIKGTLFPGKPVGGECVVKFEFADVPTGVGDGNYLIRIPGNDAIGTSEEDLRDGTVLHD